MNVEIVVDTKTFDKFNRSFINSLNESLFAFCNSLRNTIVLNKLSGNPVRRRTGNLANSIAVRKKSDFQYEVGSFGVSYAYLLEYSPRFVKYRWLKTGVNDGLNEAKKQFLTVMRRGLDK